MEQLSKAKLTIKDLGSPKNPPEDGSLKKLGRIVGIVTGTKTKLDPRGESFIALTGQFGGLTADEKTFIRSGIAYLPGGFHDEILSAWQSRNAPDKDGVVPPPTAVKFAYDAYSRAATNPIGYEYVFKAVLPPAANDPLAEMIGGQERHAIASEKHAENVDTAPVQAKAKAKAT